MKLERLKGATSGPPFPVYDDLVGTLLAAHGREGARRASGRSSGTASTDRAARSSAGSAPDRAAGSSARPAAAGASDRLSGRDPTVAHALGTCAGYAYSDIETVATMMSRLGLQDPSCVRIAQTVDAMLIFSTAYLVQSRCGRVAILCYRGTEPASLGNWLTDVDVGSDSITLGGEVLGVHSGFYRSLRVTRWDVLNELKLALEGKSLADPGKKVEHRLEALYLTGHSLGGAMAVLFALSIAGSEEHRAIAEKLRAIYTFGQPLATAEPLPQAARELGRKLHRHVTVRDLIPRLPAAPWGRFAHFGQEYRYADGEWRFSETPVPQLVKLREIPRSLLAFFASEKRRSSSRYTMAEHGAQHYISALRPKGRVTEFGDQG